MDQVGAPQERGLSWSWSPGGIVVLTLQADVVTMGHHKELQGIASKVAAAPESNNTFHFLTSRDQV